METNSWDQSRTVVVSGVPNLLPDHRMVDKLIIHFQTRRRSNGGDVEVVTYPTNMERVAFVTFDKAEDAARVVEQKQIMSDPAFPREYKLTVFPFTTDVFLYVSNANVDLSVFDGDHKTLIQSLCSAHRSIRFKKSSGKIVIEGPFVAIKALREDLVRRAAQLQSTASTSTAAAAQLRQTELNPRVTSHHEFVSSVGSSGSKTNQEVKRRSSLSPLPQSTGEETQLQSQFSNSKSHNASQRRKNSPSVGRFSNAGGDEEEKLGARSTSKMSTQYGSKWEESGAHLSGLDLLPAGRISATRPEVEDILHKHTKADRTSHRNSSDYLRESAQSSLAGAAKLQTRLNNVSATNNDDVESAIYIDSNVFRYIEKFDKKEFDRRLRGLKVSLKLVEGTDLVGIFFTEDLNLEMMQIQQDLLILVDSWVSKLRVQEIYYDKGKWPDKRRLTQICDYVNDVFDDVIYILEESSIKVVGTSVSGYLFRKMVEDKMKSKTFLW